MTHLITRAGAVIAAVEWLIENPKDHYAYTDGAQARGRAFSVGNYRYALPCSPIDPFAVSFTTLGRIVREARIPLYHSVALTDNDHRANSVVTEVIDDYLSPLGLSCDIIDKYKAPPGEKHRREWVLHAIKIHAIDAVGLWIEQA